jgi:Shikimate kinase
MLRAVRRISALMWVVWINGAVNAGKTTVGRALAARLRRARFLDGDDVAGPSHLPRERRWRIAQDRLLEAIARREQGETLVIAYPLGVAEHARLWRRCARLRRGLIVLTVAPPLRLVRRPRGDRALSDSERRRAAAMVSEGYHARRFAAVRLVNAGPSPAAMAARIALLLPALQAAHRQTPSVTSLHAP